MIYVILVNYNGLNDTLECIDSISKSTVKDYRIVVVDNDSKDGTKEYFESHTLNNVVYIHSDKNGGFSYANNIGIKYALDNDADYVLLLNNDTLVEPNFLEQLEKAAKENEKSIVSGKILYAYDKKHIWYAGGSFSYVTGRSKHIGINEVDSGQYDKNQEVSMLSGCCMFIPRKVLEEVGLMDEKYFLYCEDLEYGCRMVNKGYKLIYEPAAVIYHKVNASTSKVPGLVCYYCVRNKLDVFKKFINWKYRWIAKFVFFLENTKRTICKEYKRKDVKKAYRDYRKGVTGPSYMG